MCMRGKGTITQIEIFDTPTHHALELQLKEYYKHNEWCKKLKSKRSAQRARKALIKIKKLAHMRGLELLNLYTVDPKRQAKSNIEPGTPLYRKFMERKDK
jgi:hypothetical protein